MHSAWGIIATLMLFGFFSGGLISLSPATIATLSKNTNEYGTRMGMAFTVCAFGALVGNPIAGALLPRTTLLPKGDSLNPGPISPQFRDDNRYVKPWSFAGTAMLIASLLVVLTKYLDGFAAKEREGIEAQQLLEAETLQPTQASEAFATLIEHEYDEKISHPLSHMTAKGTPPHLRLVASRVATPATATKF
jgi:MFS family permease